MKRFVTCLTKSTEPEKGQPKESPVPLSLALSGASGHQGASNIMLPRGLKRPERCYQLEEFQT